MKKRLPDTTIYLDTSDFLITSDPNQTDIQVSERVIVTENRDSTPKEQTITGKLNLSNGLSVTSGGIDIHGDSSFYNNVTVGFNKISQTSIQSTSIFTKKLYSTYNSSYQSSDDYFSEIELTSVATNIPGTIDFKVCYYYGTSTRKHVTYRLSNDGFYVIEPEPTNSTSGSGNLGTSDHYWNKAYIKNIYGDSLQMNQIEGNVSSLYNLYRGGPYGSSAGPGSLFLASSYCETEEYEDEYGMHFRKMNSGCMLIHLLYFSKGTLTDTYSEYWRLYFDQHTFVFRRGVINSNDFFLINNIHVYDYYKNRQTNYYIYYEEEYKRYRVEVDIGDSSRLKLWFAIAKINSSPVLYNSMYMTNVRNSLYDPSRIESKTNYDYLDKIDISQWGRIAFLGEVGFQLPGVLPDGGEGQHGAAVNDYGFAPESRGVQSLDKYVAYYDDIVQTAYTLMVMRVD